MIKSAFGYKKTPAVSAAGVRIMETQKLFLYSEFLDNCSVCSSYFGEVHA